MERSLLALGTYRGRVVAIDGTLVRVVCPQVMGSAPTNWAEPSVPNGRVPALSEDVWVVFHGGDLSRPVYLTSIDIADLVRRVVALENRAS